VREDFKSLGLHSVNRWGRVGGCAAAVFGRVLVFICGVFFCVQQATDLCCAEVTAVSQSDLAKFFSFTPSNCSCSVFATTTIFVDSVDVCDGNHCFPSPAVPRADNLALYAKVSADSHTALPCFSTCMSPAALRFSNVWHIAAPATHHHLM
jgi:hypothetical protein